MSLAIVDQLNIQALSRVQNLVRVTSLEQKVLFPKTFQEIWCSVPDIPITRKLQRLPELELKSNFLWLFWLQGLCIRN